MGIRAVDSMNISSKVSDENGDVSRVDFFKLAIDNKLLDFGNVMAGDPIKSSQKRSTRSTNYATGQDLPSGKVK